MKKFIKYACFYAVGLWGMASLTYLSGEPIDENMPLSTFCICKLVGLASLGLCLIVGKVLNRAGMFPEFKDEEDCKL